eukprot:gene2646-3412_t
MGLFKKCAPGARVRDFKEEQDPDGIFLRFNGDMERLDPVIWDRNLKTYLGWQPDQFPNVVAKKTSNRDFNMKLDSEVSSEFIRIWQIAEPLIEESLAAGQVNLVAEFRCEILVLQLRNPGLKVRNAVVEAANLSAILEMIESKDKALKPWRKLRELLYAIKKISDECSSEDKARQLTGVNTPETLRLDRIDDKRHSDTEVLRNHVLENDGRIVNLENKVDRAEKEILSLNKMLKAEREARAVEKQELLDEIGTLKIMKKNAEELAKFAEEEFRDQKEELRELISEARKREEEGAKKIEELEALATEEDGKFSVEMAFTNRMWQVMNVPEARQSEVMGQVKGQPVLKKKREALHQEMSLLTDQLSVLYNSFAYSGKHNTGRDEQVAAAEDILKHCRALFSDPDKCLEICDPDAILVSTEDGALKIIEEVEQAAQAPVVEVRKDWYPRTDWRPWYSKINVRGAEDPVRDVLEKLMKHITFLVRKTAEERGTYLERARHAWSWMSTRQSNLAVDMLSTRCKEVTSTNVSLLKQIAEALEGQSKAHHGVRFRQILEMYSEVAYLYSQVPQEVKNVNGLEFDILDGLHPNNIPITHRDMRTELTRLKSKTCYVSGTPKNDMEIPPGLEGTTPPEEETGGFVTAAADEDAL